LNATLLTGDSHLTQQSRSGLLNGSIQSIYCTPEQLLLAHNFKWFEENAGQIAYIVIDEANCIYTWGNDFRPIYRELGKIRRSPNLRKIPLIVTTATAPKDCFDDIVRVLELKSEFKLIRMESDRPNISYTTLPEKDKKHFYSELVNQENQAGLVVIFCRSIMTKERVIRQIHDFWYLTLFNGKPD